jgi:hypothetical protein
LKARVLTDSTATDYTTPYANGQMTFIGDITGYDVSSLAVDTLASFPKGSGDTPYYMAGLYPYQGWGTPTTTAAITFTGKEDVMSAVPQETTLNKVVAGTVPTLTFNHLLTKLEVSVKGKTGAAAGKWGTIEKLELVEVAGAFPKTVATVTLATGNAAFSGGSSGFPLYGMSGTADSPTYTAVPFADAGHFLTTTATPVAYTMIAPFESSAANKLKFNIYTAVTQTPFSAEVDLSVQYAGNTAGRAFGIIFTFDDVERPIVSTVKVNDWIFSGDITVPVGDNQ